MGRSPPFSQLDTNRLLEIVGKYKNSIESKQSDLQTIKIKDDAWAKVESEFNAISDARREIKELKTKYKNVRYTTKTKLAAERRNLYGTGGGPATIVQFSAPEEICKNMLPTKEGFGVDNIYDADAIEEVEYIYSDPASPSSPRVIEEAQPAAQGKEAGIATPASGPSTLRAPVNSALRTFKNKNKATSWTKLADIKTKWTKEKMNADLEYAQKAMSQMEERHNMEMEILRIRLEREKLLLKREVQKY